MIFTFAEVLIKVATTVDEAYYEGKEGDFDLIVLSSDEKLETMNIDNLNTCYQSAGIDNFLVDNVEQILMNNYLKNDFEIKDVIARKNCIYVKVIHAIPFKGENKCYGASFSINYMEPNNSVSVYGYKTTNSNEKQVFQEIANELITVLS
jgi:hypothetical protein